MLGEQDFLSTQIVNLLALLADLIVEFVDIGFHHLDDDPGVLDLALPIHESAVRADEEMRSVFELEENVGLGCFGLRVCFGGCNLGLLAQMLKQVHNLFGYILSFIDGLIGCPVTRCVVRVQKFSQPLLGANVLLCDFAVLLCILIM